MCSIANPGSGVILQLSNTVLNYNGGLDVNFSHPELIAIPLAV